MSAASHRQCCRSFKLNAELACCAAAGACAAEPGAAVQLALPAAGQSAQRPVRRGAPPLAAPAPRPVLQGGGFRSPTCDKNSRRSRSSAAAASVSSASCACATTPAQVHPDCQGETSS